jgi:cytochrome c peroxidase
MIARFSAIAALAASMAIAVGATEPGEGPDSPPAAAALPSLGSLCGQEPCAPIARGAHAFLAGRLPQLDGNGRACADCHMPSDSFQLSPADVEARYQALQAARIDNPDADDPLFRPIDADDFREHADQATDFRNLRHNALVRIVLPLPANIRLIDPATDSVSLETTAEVWRSVPSVLNVAISGPGTTNPSPREPNAFGGYQLDARVRTLQEQALGAFVNHAQMQLNPSQRLLDDLAAFQGALFSSPGVRTLADAIRDGASGLPDPDPPLTAEEEQGKAVFQRACAQCHGGAAQTSSLPPIPHFQDIRTTCPRPVDAVTPARFVFKPCSTELARNERTYQITLTGGGTMRRTTSDPGRALLTGFVGGPAPLDDWNKLDVPQLHGIGRTAPYFHNNSADTLEEVLDHYDAFFTQLRVSTAPGAPAPPPTTTDGVHFDRAPLPEERAALLAYLRIL